MKKAMQPRSASSSPAHNPTPEPDWADIHLQPGDEPLLTYRSGMAVYEESLTKNRCVGRGWSGSGFVRFYNIWDCRLDPTEHPAPQAFWLEIDGQLLASDWEWGGFEKRREPGGPLHGTVTLKHRVRPVTVIVPVSIVTRALSATHCACSRVVPTAVTQTVVVNSANRSPSDPDRSPPSVRTTTYGAAVCGSAGPSAS